MLAMNSYAKLIILFALVVAFCVTGHFEESSRPEWKKISPFTAVSFEGETILAEYDGTVYELASIEGIESDELVKSAKRQFGNMWQKRIREDIFEVLIGAGAPEDRFVDLELKVQNTGAVKRVTDVEMTEGNRAIIYKAS